MPLYRFGTIPSCKHCQTWQEMSFLLRHVYLNIFSFCTWSSASWSGQFQRAHRKRNRKETGPSPAQAWPRPDFWGSGNLGTWKSGDLEILEFGISKKKIRKINIRSAQNVDKVWISREKTSQPHLGPFQLIFPWAGNMQKMLIFAYFPWCANVPYSPGLFKPMHLWTAIVLCRGAKETEWCQRAGGLPCGHIYVWSSVSAATILASEYIHLQWQRWWMPRADVTYLATKGGLQQGLLIDHQGK